MTAPPSSIAEAESSAVALPVTAHNPRRMDIDDTRSSIFRGDVFRLSQKRKVKLRYSIHTPEGYDPVILNFFEFHYDPVR